MFEDLLLSTASDDPVSFTVINGKTRLLSFKNFPVGLSVFPVEQDIFILFPAPSKTYMLLNI